MDVQAGILIGIVVGMLILLTIKDIFIYRKMMDNPIHLKKVPDVALPEEPLYACRALMGAKALVDIQDVIQDVVIDSLERNEWLLEENKALISSIKHAINNDMLTFMPHPQRDEFKSLLCRANQEIARLTTNIAVFNLMKEMACPLNDNVESVDLLSAFKTAMFVGTNSVLTALRNAEKQGQKWT